ncbi:hypothetical protein PoB_006189500 [Plakobranchus ocellatus]|uniref:Uncharacterized protein n=1 Tax=Plakobranchus ocellatus TaxID=259542 RepID=A0AAV4CUB4_9GAST|nr:hypothetical protein PoB_006189500 [Plakobranchus ocellatus]
MRENASIRKKEERWVNNREKCFPHRLVLDETGLLGGESKNENDEHEDHTFDVVLPIMNDGEDDYDDDGNDDDKKFCRSLIGGDVRIAFDVVLVMMNDAEDGYEMMIRSFAFGERVI